MNLRNSPLAKSPPKMTYIPGVTNITSENGQANLTKKGKGNIWKTKPMVKHQFDWLSIAESQGEDDAQFDMDF